MRKIWLVCGAALLASSTAPSQAAERCTMAPADREWIDNALHDATYMRKERLHFMVDSHPTIIVFDPKCRFEAQESDKPRWKGSPHSGNIHTPDGTDVPAGVMSFTSKNEKTGEVYFVMALPPVWKSASIRSALPDELGLAGVFLHEFTHVTHLPVLQPLFDAAAARFKTPDDLSDDALQAHFKNNPLYVAVWEKERDLLFRAAKEPDSKKAKELARQAYELMTARQAHWFVGNDAVWKPYDDLFLTMEGLGQWVACAWLSDSKGGRLTSDEAERGMRGSRKWWSQEEGLGLFLVVDRFVPNWAAQAFAAQPATGIELLRQAVSGQASPPQT